MKFNNHCSCMTICQSKSRLFLTFILFLSPLFLMAQKTYTVKGKVTDRTQSIPGVSIVEQGTSNGTLTDVDGNYSLTISSAGTRLSFSSVGYIPQTLPVSFTTQETITLNVTLEEEIRQLDEIVVTGSTLKSSKRELGNNITTVNAKALENAGTSSLFGALQGKVPGAQITQNSGDPAGGMTIRLRGVKSLQGTSDPLYVVDGVVMSNSTVNVSQTAVSPTTGGASVGNNRMADINPADIETINVISGAAAAAQYGSRASNGVVLITTKKGKSGAPRITFTTSYGINELRKKVPFSTYGKQFGSAGLRLYPVAAQNTPTPATGETVIPITRDGSLGYIRSNLIDVTRYDYQDYIFRVGESTDDNLSMSGGTDKTHYYTSFGYTKNEGIIRGADFTRYNFRARIEQQLTDWAKLSAGLAYSNAFTNEKANGNVFYSPINSMTITNNIYDISQRDAAGNLLGVESARVNPLSTIEDMNFTQSVNRTTSDLQFNLTPVKGLGIDWITGVDSYTQVGRGLIKPYPYAATSNLPLERYPSGFASQASNSVLLLNSDINISYEQLLARDLKLNAIVGTNYQYQRSELQGSSGQGLAPYIETVSGATSTTVVANYGLDQFNLGGVFAQATLGYKNLAFITGAMRRDLSSKFSPSQRTQTYPKLSASFVASDLEGWKNSGWKTYFSSLKLRTSWGQSGNFTGLGSYDRFWQFNPTPFLGKNTIVPSSQLANLNVRPERMTEFEYGADAGFWNDRITLGVSFYHQKITELVVNREVAPSEGGLSIVNNVGEMENKGLELIIGIVPVKTKNVMWDVSFIYNRNRNKVTKLGNPTIAITNTATGAPAYLIEGAPASVYYGTFFARDADGNEILTPQGFSQSQKGIQSSNNPLEYQATFDGAGQPTGSAVRKIIANPNPDFTGSFVSNISYQKFSLNFLLDYVQGVQIFNADKRTRQGVGNGEYAEKELKGELPRGWIYSRYLIEEWRIDDGSFVKLREVGVSYSMGKVGRINNINLGVSGRNLFSWDNYSGYDPETNAGGNSDILRGLDFGNVPIPRSYRATLTISF